MVPYCNVPECSYTTVKYSTSQFTTFLCARSNTVQSIQNITINRFKIFSYCSIVLGTLARQEKDQAVLTQHVNELRPDAPQALPCIISYIALESAFWVLYWEVMV